MASSLTLSPEQLAVRRGKYGFDEPVWLILQGIVGVMFLALAVLSFRRFALPLPGVVCIVLAALLFATVASYTYTTRRGKFEVWADILLRLGLRGDEHIVDLGCGRGAVLLMAASLLPQGQVIGIDVWNAREQSGNGRRVTQQNAVREGVAARVELRTADM